MFSINDLTQKNQFKYAFLHLGFRPFFIGAGGFAVVSMIVWMGILANEFSGLYQWPAQIWHAHEMIYGYSLAVVCGFLLTAVKNWTNVQTIHQTPLLILFALWISARIMPFVPVAFNLEIMAVLDLMFSAALIYAICSPVIKVKQWNQTALIACLIIILFGNLFFYLGMFGVLLKGISWGLFTGFYAILGFLFIMGRRVIPFFIEKGIEQDISIKNRRWLDISSAIIFIIFAIVDVFTEWQNLLAILAGILFILHSIRLSDWYHSSIFTKPMLWVLFLAYAFLVLGFALITISLIFNLPFTLAVHAFAVGGIGMMTLGMMTRVSLGHTGRNVFDPPKILKTVFILILCAALIRVFFPIINSSLYSLWIFLSQILWLSAFIIFLWRYIPMLINARVDGRYG